LDTFASRGRELPDPDHGKTKRTESVAATASN